MLIVGERINTTRKGLCEAVIARNDSFIRSEAVRQQEAGADVLDVNCGSLPSDDEPTAMAWLVRTVQGATQIPLCVDSPNPAALAAGLAVHDGRPIINSISGEKDRYQTVLPLVEEYDAQVVALGIDDRGIPEDRDRAFSVAEGLVEQLISDGVRIGDIYFDPLVRSLGTSPDSLPETLHLIEDLGKRFPGLHFISGLSNVSYGFPERRHMNRAFAVLAIASGLDTALLDPLDQTLIALILAAEALSGRDRYGLRYIEAYKDGRLAV